MKCGDVVRVFLQLFPGAHLLWLSWSPSSRLPWRIYSPHRGIACILRSFSEPEDAVKEREKQKRWHSNIVAVRTNGYLIVCSSSNAASISLNKNTALFYFWLCISIKWTSFLNRKKLFSHCLPFTNSLTWSRSGDQKIWLLKLETRWNFLFVQTNLVNFWKYALGISAGEEMFHRGTPPLNFKHRDDRPDQSYTTELHCLVT